jgi:hypothetical protein
LTGGVRARGGLKLKPLEAMAHLTVVR